jgi:hypothetical protein
MTPQERQLIDDLFDRLSRLEGAARDPDAVNAIAQGLRKAPNATYALVQTVLIQDEALKRADARIAELEAGDAPAAAPAGGFLDNMRDALFGQNQQQPRGSVPNVRPRDPDSRPAWNTGQVLGQTGGPSQPYGQQGYGQQPGGPQPYGQQPQAGGAGGSFLGTAAAAAAGAVGGGLLLNSIRGMMGGADGQKHGLGDTASLGKDAGGDKASPWSDQSSGDLARDAGANDIASSGQHAPQGAYDQASHDDSGGYDDNDFDDDFDDGGGDSDYA